MPEPEAATGTLYVVATPLGNLEDVTLRALRVLREVSLVACEDTRHTRKLLAAHGIATPTTSYFEHNERFKGEQILEALRAGRDVALVSDAGTPAISDPGERLVRDARAAGIAVVPVPGPSAAAAALSVCGLATDRFLFVGFLPAKPGAPPEGARGARERAADAGVLRDSRPRRRVALGHDRGVRRPRRLPVPRGHEGCTKSTCARALRACASGSRRVTASRARSCWSWPGPRDRAPSEDPVALYRRLAAEGLTRREAVKEAARRLGRPAREVYSIVQDAEAKSECS